MSLKLANSHEVIGIDNLSRRSIDDELSTKSLTNISSFERRGLVARDCGFALTTLIGDVTDYGSVYRLLDRYKPDVVLHTAEVRSAPYSMKNDLHKNTTVGNNIIGTHNLLAALSALKMQDRTHLVHIGTMGVYGYGGTSAVLPEGYADITIHGADLAGASVDDRRSVLYPTDPGSVYHMTKSMEQIMFAFYAKNDGLHVTDLHQGIVWGTQTVETSKDPELVNRFDYDEAYGTVLNRFLVQAAVNTPLTVYGTGGQTRGFINIRDSAQCVEWAVEDTSYEKRVRVVNQVAEFKSVAELAALVAAGTGATVGSFPNPRKEKAENSLAASNAFFTRKKGLAPLTIEQGLLSELSDVILPNIGRVDLSKIPPKTKW